MQSQAIDMLIQMLGTTAVILVVAGFITGVPALRRAQSKEKKKYIILIGLIGGLFGIYGNFAGVPYSGAIISVRDIGPMLSGFVGGPVSGIMSGLIAGAHRLILGGITAKPCIMATCIIGTLCGFVSLRKKNQLIKPHIAFITGVLMEMMHLCILLIMVKPFSVGLGIVKDIAVPFVLANAIGFTIMIAIMTYIDNKTELMAEKNRLKSELAVAEKIQRSMLPVLNDSFPGRKEISIDASMEPAKEVGGDFYDVFFTGSDKIAFLIADVSGKGVPAALFMINAQQMIKEKIKECSTIAEAVSAANDELCKRNDAEMFVTSWIGVMDLSSGHVDYVNCGHNPPVRCSTSGAEYMKVKSGLVLAGMEGIPYMQDSFEMKSGEKIFLYTDGVTEAENERFDQFGEDALLYNLNAICDADSSQMVTYIREKISEHVAGFEQSDDITMLCIRFNGMYNIRHYDAAIENIVDVTAFAEEEMESRGIPVKVIYNFNVTIDELLSNVCKYSGAENMWAGIRITDDEVAMRFENDGDPFDPDNASEPDLTSDIEDRNIGGLGLFMVRNMMDSFEYKYENGRNIITVSKKYKKN